MESEFWPDESQIENAPKHGRSKIAGDNSLIAPHIPVGNSENVESKNLTITTVAMRRTNTQTTSKEITRKAFPTFAKSCRDVGRHPHPDDCEKFLLCTMNDVSVIECPIDLAYNRNARRCMRDWASCPSIAPCKYAGQKLTVPHDRMSYLQCSSRLSGIWMDKHGTLASHQVLWKRSNYRVLKRRCARGQKFSLAKQECNCMRSGGCRSIFNRKEKS